MTLLIDNRQTLYTEELQGFFEKAVQAALEHLNIHHPVEVSLVLVDNREIQDLNRAYRGKDKATDVLSFPLLELDPLEDADYYKTLAGGLDPDSHEVVLGDIVISVEKAMAQAEEYAHSVARELGFLLVHGLLHLLGYDHERDSAAEEIMGSLQEAILRKLKLPRE